MFLGLVMHYTTNHNQFLLYDHEFLNLDHKHSPIQIENDPKQPVHNLDIVRKLYVMVTPKTLYFLVLLVMDLIHLYLPEKP